jgi:hypothetical protein
MTRKPCCRIRGHMIKALACASACAPWASGQAPPAAAMPDNAAAAPEVGIRLTPGMARAMASVITRQAIVKRYGLDAARSEEVSEKIARRLMQMAHANGRQAQEMLEFALPAALEFEARHTDPTQAPRELWMRFARQAHPLVPAVRRLFTDIREDVQPLLPPGQQFKMAGDMLAVAAALDAFEKTMERWSRGDVNPGENPFDTDDRQIKKDENGESAALKRAREHAEERLDDYWRSTWQGYVEQAAKLYGFDDTQRAAADSILREAVGRAEAVTKDETWRGRAVRNRLWNRLIWNLRPARFSPLPDLISGDFIDMFKPLRVIGDELRERVDNIPTQAQRDAAEARVRAALAEAQADLAGQ